MRWADKFVQSQSSVRNVNPIQEAEEHTATHKGTAGVDHDLNSSILQAAGNAG